MTSPESISVPIFTPEATFQINFKRYLSVCLVFTTLCLFAHDRVCAHTHTHLKVQLWHTPCTHTHTFAKLSVAAICEFIKAFGRLLGVCAVWLDCYCFPACHLYGTHHQWPHAWRLEHRPGLQLWLLCRRRGGGKQARYLFTSLFSHNHICSPLCLECSANSQTLG